MDVSETSENKKIVIAGAGSVGCFVGGVIATNGGDVRFLARSRIASMLLTHGLTVSDLYDMRARIAADSLKLSTDPAILGDADIILVTVKSDATLGIAEQIKRHAPQGALIISLQNGVQNTRALREALQGFDIRAGVVPFNVITTGDGRFHRGVAGRIVVEAGMPSIAATLTTPSLSFVETQAIADIQWGKLLINLNNALNALSNLPLRTQLHDREWRRLFSDLMVEGLSVLKLAGIKARSPFSTPFPIFAAMLKLPTPLYKTVAGSRLRIDPEARSSMWEDLQRGRKTEIGELQGAVLELGKEFDVATPVNARVFELIREFEARSGEVPKMTPAEIRDGI